MQNQLTIFSPEEDDRRCIMISLHPEYYNQLCSGEKKYEYRRGQFVREPVNAFVYCTTPVMHVGAFVKFGTPISGTPEKIAQVKEDEVAGSFKMMMDWMQGFKAASAVPIEEVQTFPPIKLSEIRSVFPEFQPPQRFTYIDKQQELFEFLKKKSGISTTSPFSKLKKYRPS